MHFTVAGHCCLDLVIRSTKASSGERDFEEASPIELHAGGATANAGRALVALGAEVSLYCALSKDRIGDITLSLLEASNLGDLHVHRVPASGSYSLVVDAPGTDRTFRHHVGANQLFDPAMVGLSNPTWLHFGYPSLTPSVLQENGEPLRKLFAEVRAAGGRTSLDLAAVPSSVGTSFGRWRTFFENVLPVTDAFVPSWDDLAGANYDIGDFEADRVSELGAEFVAMGATTILITAGSQGSAVLTPTDDVPRYCKPSVPGPVTRTNGAGDTFKASFVYQLSRGKTAHEAQDLATVAIRRFLSPEGDG